MRLWSFHPRYLDARGLVALWREALLAQAVLKGETRGYTRHPQLIRFRESVSPLESIAFYLYEIYADALHRDYRLDAAKIGSFGNTEKIPVTRGQLDFEWMHFKAKLKVRDLDVYEKVVHLRNPRSHPLFHVMPGPVAEWEVIKPRH